MQVNGLFDVKLDPQESLVNGKDGVQLGHIMLDKQFHGSLSGRSLGQMLSAMTTTKGSAGYVAIEQFSGMLDGKHGSFVMQHFGVMDQGQEQLKLQIIPDSGAGELKGISGTMKILRENGKHQYELKYTFEKPTPTLT